MPAARESNSAEMHVLCTPPNALHSLLTLPSAPRTHRLTNILVPPMPLLPPSIRDAHLMEARHGTEIAFLFRRSTRVCMYIRVGAGLVIIYVFIRVSIGSL
eukprot:IDg3917t1